MFRKIILLCSFPLTLMADLKEEEKIEGQNLAPIFKVVFEEEKIGIDEIRSFAKKGEDWAIVEMFEYELKDGNLENSVLWAMEGIEKKVHDIVYTLKGYNPKILKKEISIKERNKLVQDYVSYIIKLRK